MSKESTDRRDEWRNLSRLGCLAAASLLCACDTRPTGDEDVIAIAQSIASPDGVTVDLTGGFVYWTNMGTPYGGTNVGTLQRMKLDAETVETVIPIGTTNTPKQISIDAEARKLYWCDRGETA